MKPTIRKKDGRWQIKRSYGFNKPEVISARSFADAVNRLDSSRRAGSFVNVERSRR